MRNPACSISVALLSALSFVLPGASIPLQEPATSKNIKVYKAGKHVTVPVLLPTEFTTSVDAGCQSPTTGEAQFAEIVDASGTPLNIFWIRPIGNGLDELALQIAAKDRFKPVEKDGAPVAVSIKLEIRLEGCTVSETGASGYPVSKLRLTKQPVQKIGPATDFEPEELPAGSSPTEDTSAAPRKIGRDVSAPVPVYTPEAKYTAEAKQKDIQGACILMMIIDAYGIPENIRVVRPLGYGLDQAAIEAVKTYRFRPAMRDHRPVPVMMTIEVNFRLR